MFLHHPNKRQHPEPSEQAAATGEFFIASFSAPSKPDADRMQSPRSYWSVRFGSRRLAGQSALYIRNQFDAWRTGTQQNDPMGLMAQIAKKLDKNEVAEVAAYYAAMPKITERQHVEATTNSAQQHRAEESTGGPASAFTPPPESAIPR